MPTIYDVRKLGPKLSQMRGVSNVVVVANANVRIVKFQANIDDVVFDADLNVNVQLGIVNSRLIAAYCELSFWLRPLAFLVKHWAKSKNLNDPSANRGGSPP